MPRSVSWLTDPSRLLFCSAAHKFPIVIGEQRPPFAMVVQFELMDACGYILGLFPAHVIVCCFFLSSGPFTITPVLKIMSNAPSAN
jgi:hypothetical protein